MVDERTPDIAAGRLTAEQFVANFTDLHPPLDRHQALVEPDMVFKAIGQTFVPKALNGAGQAIVIDGGRIQVDDERRTSLAGVWAGGDCIVGGEDLTVVAVEDGKIAAESINRALAG